MSKKRENWTFEKIHAEALKYKTRTDFQMNSKGAYLAAYRRKILDLVCSHMEVLRIYWTKELVKKEALKYKTRSEFQDKSGGAYMFALNLGILDEVCAHMPKHVDQSGENNPAFRWSNDKLRSELKKYSTRRELREKNYAAYMAAVVKDDYEDMCSHMPPVCNEAYTKEELFEIISRYETKGDLIRENGSVHVIACKRDDYEEMCKHMKPSPHGSSVAERELFAIIKAIYSNAKKFKDMRVKIEGKSHIKGFEIDILVDSLGIEFDGTYHHSFEYMRKSSKKSKWSDEEIKKYPDLKDAWFATKGIKILHIKEEDWKKDKQVCIQKCLDFLGVSQCP